MDWLFWGNILPIKFENYAQLQRVPMLRHVLRRITPRAVTFRHITSSFKFLSTKFSTNDITR